MTDFQKMMEVHDCDRKLVQFTYSEIHIKHDQIRQNHGSRCSEIIQHSSSDGFVQIYQKYWMKCFNNLHTHVSKSAHCATLAIWSNHFISLNHSIMFIRTKYFWFTRCYLSSFDGLVMYHIQPQSRNIRYLIRTKKLTRSEKISR